MRNTATGIPYTALPSPSAGETTSGSLTKPLSRFMPVSPVMRVSAKYSASVCGARRPCVLGHVGDDRGVHHPQVGEALHFQLLVDYSVDTTRPHEVPCVLNLLPYLQGVHAVVIFTRWRLSGTQECHPTMHMQY